MNNNNLEPRILTAVRVRVPCPSEDIHLDAVPGVHVPMMRFGMNTFPYEADYLLCCGFQQEPLFEIVAKPQLQKFIKGEDNVTILAFGQRFSGKTFTLFGPGSQLTDSAVYYGIYPRLCTYIFSQFDPFMYFASDPQVKVYVAFFEEGSNNLKDLLSNKNMPEEAESNIFSGGLTDEFLVGLTHEMCTSARMMILWLNVALNNRQMEPTHLFCHIIIEQVVTRDDQLVKTRTTALFVEVANCLINHPQTNNMNNRVMCREDHYVLRYLATTLGERVSSPITPPEINYLCHLLKQSFNGDRLTLAICCLCPSLAHANESSDYLNTLTNIMAMRNNEFLQEQEELARVSKIEASQANSLLSSAESLLSKLSLTQSISEEDKEQLQNWLTLKKECEESINAQSHQLECIEEVTESEEEIASSDEKMSESPDSLDNSISESDQEEGDSKVCQLSDDDFFSSLDNMCVQFNTFVDKFVDSFKAKTSLSPAKERKRAYSATRRGGLPELPRVSELKATCTENPARLHKHEKFVVDGDGQTKHVFNKVYEKFAMTFEDFKKQREREQKEVREDLGGCIRRAPRNIDETKKDRRGPDDKPCFVLQPSSADGNAEDGKKSLTEEDKEVAGMYHPDENDPENGKYITWSMVDPNILTEYDLVSWLERHEEDIWMIRNVLKTTVKEEKECEELIANTLERSKQLFYAIAGIDPLINMMKDQLMFDSAEPEAQHCGLNHVIRYHRIARQEFVDLKLRLDACVKNKTANEQEQRDFLMADEMIESLDSCIEFLNFMIISGKPAEQKLPRTEVCQKVMDKIKNLTSLEMKNLIFKYFIKVVDLRENSKAMEHTIVEYEKSLELANERIAALSRKVHNIRGEQSQLVKYPRSPGAQSGEDEQGACGGASPLPTSPLALTQGSNTRSKRGPAIPRQNFSKLQVKENEEVSTTVKLTRDKLVIEQKKKHK